MDAPDYKQLVGPQMQDFIEKCQAQFPNNATDQKIEEQRAAYQKLCLDLSSGRPAGVVSSDDMIQHIPVRRYLFDRAFSESKNKNSTNAQNHTLTGYWND